MVETDGWRLTESGDAEETLYHMYQKPQKQKVRLHYIPYYTWANRGENEMQVWTRVQNLKGSAADCGIAFGVTW